ncbi:MAG: carboxypeptidase regulatory-like domain-containing protein [Gemmatimonadales bacterium]
MIGSRVRSATLLLATIAVAVGGRAEGQEVSGVAHISGSALPIGGTTIVLIDRSGVMVTGTLTQPDGRYALRLPSAGQFRLRARRIGFSPDSSAVLDFNSGSQLHFDPTMTPLRTTLEVVRVEGIQKCEVGHESGDAAYELWEAAQNALAATIAAAGDKLFAYRLERFLREVDPNSARVIHASTWRGRSLSSEPYYSVSPDSLAVTGFARTEGDSSVYYAPDARTLTSDAFIRDHCLRAVKDSARPNQLGLAFEPERRSRLVDVSGVLWIDRASSELRDLEYRYEMPATVRGRQLLPRGGPATTGHIEYRRLDNGAWIVDNWAIRVPVLAHGASSPYGRISTRPQDLITKAVWEVGGDVRGFAPRDSASTLPEDNRAGVDGRVVGGAAQLPVVGAELTLSSITSTRAPIVQRTQAEGVFAFDTVAPGAYELRMTKIEFDTVFITLAAIPLTLGPGNTETLTITLPDPEERRIALCRGSSARSVIVHGTVTDSTSGVPVPRARVAAIWRAADTSAVKAGAAPVAREREVFTDKEGQYVFCDLEPTAEVTVGSSAEGARSKRAPGFALREGGIYMVNFRIAR